MLRNKSETPTRPSSSIPKPEGGRNNISPGTVIVGDVNAEGDLRIEGKVVGNVVCNGKLVISKSGIIEGIVDARNMIVEGEIRGNVVTRELLQIDQTGKVFGDVFTQKLVLHMGATFTGKSYMSEAAKEALSKAPQKASELLSKAATKDRKSVGNSASALKGQSTPERVGV